MSNSIVRTLQVQFIIYALIYLLGVVYKFEFYNPIGWLSDIPSWDGHRRVGLLIGIVLSSIGHSAFGRFWFKKQTLPDQVNEYEYLVAQGVVTYLFAFVIIICSVVLH